MSTEPAHEPEEVASEGLAPEALTAQETASAEFTESSEPTPEDSDDPGPDDPGPDQAPEVDDESIPCPVYDDAMGRPCGEPTQSGTLTCVNHRVRATSTQLSRMDNARRRYGM